MSGIPIVSKENPVLRKKAALVPLVDITSDKIKDVISRMKEALESQDDGVGIAAPQIGESLAIFIVSHKVFEHIEEQEGTESEGQPKKKYEDMICINPQITKLSKTKKWLEEGCLSVRYLYGKIQRSTKATLRAYNEKGEVFERGGSGLLAQIFQHETDHLEGVLFIDNAKDIEDLPPESPKARSRRRDSHIDNADQK